jgi:hypothetical protein
VIGLIFGKHTTAQENPKTEISFTLTNQALRLTLV